MEDSRETGAPISDIAFTPAVKAVQERKGSRKGYAKMEAKGGWNDIVTDDLAAFIDERDSFYLGTANAEGQPYIQHRGGKPGFLKVLDETTLAFADFKGNRQYITAGNLAENDKAYIFLMDYANGEAEEPVQRPHPIGVPLGEVVVDRDDMHAFAGQRVEVDGERGHQRLALPGLHLRDKSVV